MNLEALGDIYLPVTDLERSVKWFTEHFGLKVVQRHTIPASATLAFPSNHFVLVESPSLNRYSHIPFNFHTNRIADWHALLQQRGVTTTALVQDGDMICCDFYDPDGNRIGLVEEHRDGVSEPYIEVGGTFLAVRELEKAVQWYKEALEFDFAFFSATGAAGYVGPTPEYVPDLTIHYAAVKRGGLRQGTWTRMALVQTPEVHPLVHPPYSIRSLDAEADYQTLKNRGVDLSALHEEPSGKWFLFRDLDGNEVRIFETASGA